MQPPVDAHWDDGPGVLDVAGRYRRWLLLAGVLGALAGVGLSLLQPPSYSADANLFLAAADAANAFNEEDAQRRVRNQVERLQSREVATRAAESLGGEYTADSVLDVTEVVADVEADLITVTATAGSAQEAADVANALGQAYIDSVEEQVQETTDAALTELEANAVRLRSRLREIEARLEAQPDDGALIAQRDALAGQLATLTGRADQLAVDASLHGSGVQLFEPAVAPEAPDSNNAVRNGIGGALLGVVLATAIGWRRLQRDTKAHGRYDPGEVIGIPLLGPVPKFEVLGVEGVLPTLTDLRSPAGEAYHFIIAALDTRLRKTGGHVIAVTSPQPGDGKTVTAINLAVAASRDDRDILIVDADARVQGLSRLTKFRDGRPGLHELQQDPDNLVWSDSRRDFVDAPGTEVVPVGSDIVDPAAFFRTAGFRSAMRRIRDHADLVIIDCPPLLAVSESWAIAEQVDGIVLVIAQDAPLEVLEEVRDRLALIDTPVLGYVFNRADEEGAPYAYHYDAYQSAALPPIGPPSQLRANSGFETSGHRRGTSTGIAAMQEGRRF